MRFSTIFSLILVTVPVTVSACEGDCIVGITNTYLDYYDKGPIEEIYKTVASQISDIMPNHPGPSTVMTYLQPILDAYKQQAYDGMETAIFPSYFHGKCLDANGNEPAGCPNPDCPIVCGTPGSLVHFFPHLRYIAFNQTRHIMNDLTRPGSDTYKQVEQNVLEAAQNGHQASARMLRVYGRSMPIVLELQKRASSMKDQIRVAMDRVTPLLELKCGGSGNGDTNGLPDCSWEEDLKKYILSFP
ncbi:hypothetical protein EUX98_g3289 [Antrodiella citrinella]|uniref:Uncharacterized protein n=1 Tax=Antrodiella citrinella TaxID=2447956 RepID=A0A4S4MZE8_9APHY|nr:hypothetical protein EUX98_g3289 [Antrodiella citrinella]